MKSRDIKTDRQPVLVPFQSIPSSVLQKAAALSINPTCIEARRTPSFFRAT